MKVSAGPGTFGATDATAARLPVVVEHGGAGNPAHFLVTNAPE